MNHPNTLLEKLASSSLRRNKSLIVLGALVLLLLGISSVGVQRMIEEQRNTMNFHFARLMEDLHEQETFLHNIAHKSKRDEFSLVHTLPPFQQKPLPDEGPNIYEGREYSFSLPFSVKINPDKIATSQYAKIFALGTYLSNYYSAFWSASHYQSPQVILFNTPDNFDIAVPAAGRLRDVGQLQGGSFIGVMQQVTQRLHEQGSQPLNDRVHWVPYPPLDNKAPSPILLAYVNIELPTARPTIQGAHSSVVVASLLNLSQINNIERLMQWSIYDRFTLIGPSGEVLVGELKPGQTLDEGVNFSHDGLILKLTSPGEQPWTGIYVITFKTFLDHAFWPLLGLLLLVLAGLGCGRAFNRWYLETVVMPAHDAHASIAESEAFSRALIDTAPTGLCVVRRSDHKVLLENQIAQHGQDTDRLISELRQQHDLNEAGQADLEMEGRHLHVAFVGTRYKAQDAWLCAFHDVTRHIEDAAALQAARKAADSANAAKSRFLATMSHEIRTPLYGVLGTLELLELTTLAPRQQNYLHTIQRSSSTLFQLISDVLDVSKIEAGQMNIEARDFCPLELSEDCVRTYSAVAEAKGLQLYACIDATLPDRVCGDPLRIRQVLNNLLSNAIKFTENGRVVLRVHVIQTQAGICHLTWQVSDSGIGISPAQQHQLFDPFYQASDATSQGGAGLGLAICKWLAELMGGELEVVSEPGLGSSFILQLALPTAPGELLNCPPFRVGGPAVQVRTQTPELTQHLCAWLNRLGVDTRPINVQTAQPALLLDVSPSASEGPWAGPRVVATANGRNPPQYTGQGWEVDLHDIRAIAWAIFLQQQGATSPPPTVIDEKLRKLDLRILVAEDNPINGAIIKEQLEALGCSVVIAVNGEQALAKWLPGQFDVVLTDVNMPIMNGYELAAALRDRDADLPIIGVTANALREEDERCAAVGMNAWIAKPLNLQTLRAHLGKYSKITGAAAVMVAAETPAPVPAHDRLQLSANMRELFVSTLQEDLRITLQALDNGDASAVAQQLHSMAGALGAVQLSSLARALAALECQLTGFSVTPALAQEVRLLLQQLNTLLSTQQ